MIWYLTGLKKRENRILFFKDSNNIQIKTRLVKEIETGRVFCVVMYPDKTADLSECIIKTGLPGCEIQEAHPTVFQ